MRAVARHIRIRAWRAIAGTVFGAGLSSLARAAAGPVPSFGPQAIEVFGYPVPVLSALFGLIGVLLARRVAPVSPGAIRLGNVGNTALTALLALGVLALVVTGEKRPTGRARVGGRAWLFRPRVGRAREPGRDEVRLFIHPSVPARCSRQHRADRACQ
jgi:hypothetical protein